MEKEVYEYMPNRSLDDHLFNRALPRLPWKTRSEIILREAEGLASLHEGMEIKVIYRDFKSSNRFVGDLISRQSYHEKGPLMVTTTVVGTYGYTAPEHVETGHLTIQCDVRTFGTVLYEILTGRRAVERNQPSREQKLLNWVKDYPAGGETFIMIIDPQLRDQYSYSAARREREIGRELLQQER